MQPTRHRATGVPAPAAREARGCERKAASLLWSLGPCGVGVAGSPVALGEWMRRGDDVHLGRSGGITLWEVRDPKLNSQLCHERVLNEGEIVSCLNLGFLINE